jgi:hypothetical protein
MAYTPPWKTERDRLLARLSVNRARLAAMGPPAHDRDANAARRRVDLERTIVDLEAALGIQLALPDVALVDERPVDPDAHHAEQAALELDLGQPA